MITFDEIVKYRDYFINSLIQWASESDGLYRSIPSSTILETPSYTNTGAVLQALNESGKTHFAQKLANNLIEQYKACNFECLPAEKSKEKSKSHVINNSWAIFSLLECYPGRVSEFKKICDWFLYNQKEDNSWDFIPGEDTKYPITTAYALSALLQFYDCYNKCDDLDHEYIKIISESIINGIKYLCKNRYEIFKKKDLYLWPSSLNSSHVDQISFCTSANCIHVIFKASRLLNKLNWGDRSSETLLELVDGFKKINDGEFKVANATIKIWDQIPMNESSLNYTWCFFAPLNLTTILKCINDERFISNINYYRFIDHLVSWITNNAINYKDSLGVRGSQYISEVKVWSTAYSVIVLSRIINNKYELNKLDEYHRKTVATNIEFNNFVEKVDKEIKSYEFYEPIKKKYLVLINLVILTFISFIIFSYFKDKAQENWDNIEGIVWLLTSLISSILLLSGINIEKVRDKLYIEFKKFLYSRKIILKIRKLVDEHKQKP